MIIFKALLKQASFLGAAEVSLKPKTKPQEVN
jgi:hypothetical protein